MSTIAPGQCRHCRCTEENACQLANGDPCSWIDPQRLVCSNPECIKAEQARVAAARASAPPSLYRGWGYGAIVEHKRRQSRSRRRPGQKGNAA